MHTCKIEHVNLKAYYLKYIYYHSGPKLSVSAVIFRMSRGLRVSVNQRKNEIKNKAEVFEFNLS